MPITLPAHSPRTRSLTAVLPELRRALDGRGSWLPPARSAILAVLDGVGVAQLRARGGHARFLAGISGPREVARTTFPSTTATALTSLLTGAAPGQHGIVGYRVRVPETGAVANQLHGWEDSALPETWQRAQPLSVAASPSSPVFVVSKPEFAHTGFSRSTTGSATFIGVADLEERIARAGECASSTPGALVYLYIPELDGIGHRFGWESENWWQALERVDAALRDLALAAPSTGLVVTADHGMIDVPAHRHVLLEEGDSRVEAVAEIAGEPRMLHLYAEPGEAEGVRERWHQAEGERAWVMTRDEAISANLFGPVDPQVYPRIGDVLVAARASIAYYDDRILDRSSQNMIGQHGSLTVEETMVPLLRAGAFGA